EPSARVTRPQAKRGGAAKSLRIDALEATLVSDRLITTGGGHERRFTPRNCITSHATGHHRARDLTHVPAPATVSLSRLRRPGIGPPRGAPPGTGLGPAVQRGRALRGHRGTAARRPRHRAAASPDRRPGHDPGRPGPAPPSPQATRARPPRPPRPPRAPRVTAIQSAPLGRAPRLPGVSPATARRWAAAGRITTHRAQGGRRLTEGRDLAAFSVELARAAPAEEDTPYTSARNAFPGIVTAIKLGDVAAQVEIQAGPHRLVSLLTREAVEDLGLEVGMEATARVKSTNVHIDRT